VNVLLAGVLVLLGATLWNGDADPQHDINIVISNSEVTAVGKNVQIPRGAERIELGGALVTPGLVDAASTLGLIELTTGEPSAIEGTLGDENLDMPIRAALMASDTFDASALAISVARQQGITSAVLLPFGGVISGQAAWVSLSPDRLVRNRSLALVASVRADSSVSEPGARSRAFLHLRAALEDARLYRAPGNRGAYIRGTLRELAPSAADLEALARTLEGNAKLIVRVDRASDILTTLEILSDQKLTGVLVGAREGWQVARQIARAKVPVIVDPLANLPDDLDSLASRADNARILLEAGVRVAFMHGGPPTQAGRLRVSAGNAIARGYPRGAALQAITRVPAEIFGMSDEGRIRVGARANLVVWNGDPFEPTQWPERVFIEGRELDLTTRQDELTERYRER